MEPFQIFLLVAGGCVFGAKRVRNKILDRFPLWLDGLVSCGAATMFVAGASYTFWKDVCFIYPSILSLLLFGVLFFAYTKLLKEKADDELPTLPFYFKAQEPLSHGPTSTDQVVVVTHDFDKPVEVQVELKQIVWASGYDGVRGHEYEIYKNTLRIGVQKGETFRFLRWEYPQPFRPNVGDSLEPLKTPRLLLTSITSGLVPNFRGNAQHEAMMFRYTFYVEGYKPLEYEYFFWARAHGLAFNKKPDEWAELEQVTLEPPKSPPSKVDVGHPSIVLNDQSNFINEGQIHTTYINNKDK